LLHER